MCACFYRVFYVGGVRRKDGAWIVWLWLLLSSAWQISEKTEPRCRRRQGGERQGK
jgi:hypothetical protein